MLGSLTRRLLSSALLILVWLGALELTCRLFWKTQGVWFWSAQRTLHWKFYSEMKSLESGPRGRCSNCFDILMLGGSALTPRFGEVQAALTEQLSRVTSRAIRVYNLARVGHTSLDSFYKYRHLGGRHFDLVIVYEAINETRANDFPPELFRSDYSQFPWYAMVNAEERGFGHRRLVLPYTLEFAYISARGNSDVAMSRPKPEWAKYGCDVKTVNSFRNNVEGIVRMAKDRRDPVLLMTYGYWLAPGYSEAAMRKRQLDYAEHLFPVEEWGLPECVSAGLDAHNAATREIAASHPEVLFVDQAALMPKGGDFYNDVCHMTVLGSERFARNMIGAIASLIPHADRRPQYAADNGTN